MKINFILSPYLLLFIFTIIKIVSASSIIHSSQQHTVDASYAQNAKESVFVSHPLLSSTAFIQSLNGDDWSAISSNGSVKIPSAEVPGCIYTDLQRSGLFQDPLYRFNPDLYLWAAKDYYWDYTKIFDDQGVSDYNYIELVFHGLDSVANITFNGQMIGSTNNMFRRYRFDVTDLYKKSNNNLTVRLESAYTYGSQLLKEYPLPIPWGIPRIFVRKPSVDWGWDFAPELTSLGIWKSVELQGFNEAVIDDVVTIQTFASEMNDQQRKLHNLAIGDVLLNTTAYIRISPRSTNSLVDGVLQVTVANTSATSGQISLPRPSDGNLSYSVSILSRIENPNLWTVAGYGEQTLYTLNVSFTASGGELSTSVKNIGFRSIKIIREPIPGQAGTTFYFQVNGVRIFVRGSNLVPTDIFHSRSERDSTDTTRFVQSAYEANLVLLRIWGGGIYESDTVFDLADRLGIMLWQEGSFANALYPANQEFFDNVREEATQAVRRLATHPSLAVLCGNNEIEGDNMWSLKEDELDQQLIPYNDLYVRTMRSAVVREIGNSVEWLTSSPSNGPLSLEPYVQRWGYPRNLSFDDDHYYNYDVDCADVSTYPLPRFLTEWGFQSYPSFLTFLPVTSEQDWTYNSTLMTERQRHPDGNNILFRQISRHFIPQNSTNITQNFDDFTYLTQSVQALCYQSTLQYYRTLKDQAPSYTQGVMFWQLNDMWQSPTWSSIEVHGRWKQTHYAVKRAHRPINVIAYISPLDITKRDRSVYIYVASDIQTDITGSLNVELLNWQTGNSMSSYILPISVSALSSKVFINQTFDAFLSSLNTSSSTSGFVQLTLTVNSPMLTIQNVLYLSPIANSTLLDPKIKLSTPQLATQEEEETVTISENERVRRIEYQEKQHFDLQNRKKSIPSFSIPPKVISSTASPLVRSVTFTVSSSSPAPFTWLETVTPGRFSDNSFLLLPQSPVNITFVGWEDFTLPLNIQVRSIRDTYTRG